MPFEKESFYSVLAALLFLCGSFFVLNCSLLAEDSPAVPGARLLISEVYIGGDSARDEFVELYNPNAYAVSLEGWSLKKRAKDGGSDYTNLSSDLGIARDPVTGKKLEGSGSLSVPALGYFLLVPRTVCTESGTGRCYTGNTEPDGYYSVKDASIAEDNSLTLFDPQKRESDKAGWGQAADSEGNVFAAGNLAGKSIGRISVSGQMQDTDDNSKDFALQDAPSPMNTKSSGVRVDQPLPLEKEEEKTVTDNTDNDDSGQTTPAPLVEDRGKESEERVDVVISELLINPQGEDSKLEFIEVYNRGGAGADLSGWVLEDQAGKTGTYVFQSGTNLAAGEYRAFYSSQTRLSLNNDGDGAVLKDAAGASVYKTPLSGKAEEMAAFAWSGSGWAWTSEPTPGKANFMVSSVTEDEEASEIAPVVSQTEAEVAGQTEDDVAGPAYDFSDAVIISEIFPDPVGRDNKDESWEWIEFYNEGGQAVDLRGWCVDDVLEKGSKTFCFSESRKIAAYGFMVLYGNESRLALNNTEDEVNLLWPDKKIVDSVAYEKSKEGYSYVISSDGSWRWSEKPTVGKTNIIRQTAGGTGTAGKNKVVAVAADEEQEKGSVLAAEDVSAEGQKTFISITEAKLAESSSQVCVTGIISAPVGILGDGILYISDKESGDGIQVATNVQTLSSFYLGDEVSLCGTADEVGGEQRIVLGSEPAQRLSSDNQIKVLTLDSGREKEQLGALVKTEAGIRDITSAGMMYLIWGADGMKVYAEPETGVSFSGLAAGKKASVTGIWSRTSEGYRLLPRYGSDIRLLEKSPGNGIILANEKTATTGSGSLSRPWILILFSLVLVLLGRFRRKIKLPGKGTVRNAGNNNH